jgi:hypothetical protein
MNDAERIDEVEIERDKQGGIESVRFAFGPHYFVQVMRKKGRLELCLGATHHGFRSDASEVNGELERFVEEIKRAHPDNAF